MHVFNRAITLAILASTVLAAPALHKRQCPTTPAPAPPTSTLPPPAPEPTLIPNPIPPPEEEPEISTTTVDPVPTSDPLPPAPEPTLIPNPIPPSEPETTAAPVPSPEEPAPEPPAPTEPAPAPEPTRDPNQACNGHPSLCERSFGDVVFVGSHDSYAVDDGTGGIIGISSVSSNQNIPVVDQLNLGVRLMQAQTRFKDDVLHVCHTDCLLYDGGSLEGYLKVLADWLNDEKNRNEVLTLVVTNNENVEVAKWADIFKAAGLEPLVFKPDSVPTTRDAWPTLGSMIDSNERVAVLMDYNADTNSVPWILPEFDVMWESHYNEVDENFPCAVDRVNGDAAGKLGMANHYLDKELLGVLIPDRGAADQTNSVDSISKQVDTCRAIGDNIKVTHVLLDWVDKGQAVEAARKLNGIE